MRREVGKCLLQLGKLGGIAGDENAIDRRPLCGADRIAVVNMPGLIGVQFYKFPLSRRAESPLSLPVRSTVAKSPERI